MWRPRLVARRDRSGRVRGPTTRAVVWNLIVAGGAALALLVVLGRGARVPGGALVFVAFVALVVGRALWEAWAWFAATDAEREAFRRYVASVPLDRDPRRGGPTSRPIGSRWSNGFLAGLAAVTAACFALSRYRVEFLVVAMLSLAFLAVVVLDRFRAARRARDGDRDGAP